MIDVYTYTNTIQYYMILATCLISLSRRLGGALNALNSNARNAIPSESCSFERKSPTTSARESLQETPRSSERCYFALTCINTSTNKLN